jgi:hypothetical protein
MFHVPGLHVPDVAIDEQQRYVLIFESDQVEHRPRLRGSRCRSWPPGPYGHDAPCFGGVTLVRWLKRIWRCHEHHVRRRRS